MVDFCSEKNIVWQAVVATIWQPVVATKTSFGNLYGWQPYHAVSRWRSYWLLKATQPSRSRVHQRAYPFLENPFSDFFLSYHYFSKSSLSSANFASRRARTLFFSKTMYRQFFLLFSKMMHRQLVFATKDVLSSFFGQIWCTVTFVHSKQTHHQFVFHIWCTFIFFSKVMHRQLAFPKLIHRQLSFSTNDALWVLFQKSDLFFQEFFSSPFSPFFVFLNFKTGREMKRPVNPKQVLDR